MPNRVYQLSITATTGKAAQGVTVVTGAARGMGRACADALARPGAHLVVVDLDAEGLALAAAELAPVAGRGRVHAVVADVAEADDVARVAERVESLGPLGEVAHAAGISPSMGDWRRIVTVDLVGSARLLDALEPLAGPASAAVCFASLAGYRMAGRSPAVEAVLAEPLAPDLLEQLEAVAGPDIHRSQLAYAWAKRGVHLLVEQRSRAWGAAGARLCSVSPGLIDTPQGRMEFARQPHMAAMVDQSPLRRQGTPEEVAAVVAFLLSAAASFVSGCDLRVDGGLVAMGVAPLPTAAD